MAVGVDLPVGAGRGQLLPQRDDFFGRHHRIVPAVEGDHLGLDLLRRQPGRIEEAMEAHRRGDVSAASSEVERAHSAEAIAGDDDLTAFDLVQSARQIEHVSQAPAKRGAVAFQPIELAKHRIAGRATEILAEDVGDQRIIAELDQLPRETDLEVGDAHDRRDQDHRRARLPVTPADEHALQLSPSNWCGIARSLLMTSPLQALPAWQQCSCCARCRRRRRDRSRFRRTLGRPGKHIDLARAERHALVGGILRLRRERPPAPLRRGRSQRPGWPALRRTDWL